uniref:Retrotransposon gag domain-containing protein n=1 Tax=Nelumbo nucifera TaxID=4432 RepID=A0A822YJ83_NELNU|nr:TPA_asm: hypothetical protein HUJ06_030906 [Nelumbo nucifera]
MDRMEGQLHKLDGDLKEMKETLFVFISQFEKGSTRLMKDGKQEGSSGDSQQVVGTPHVRNAKVNFPIFSGEDDPVPWVNRAEQYFEYHNIPASQSLQLASIHLDGEANVWYQWYWRSHPQLTWLDFTEALNVRFRPFGFDDFDEVLAKI